MANTTLSPNMDLPLPIVGVQTGPVYATDLNNCLTIVDGHDHTPGYGVPVPSDGININADLPFSNNNATTVRTVRFQSQSAALSAAADVGCLYEVSNDLYYNDGAGNQIRITQSGSVTGSSGTITGLPSGTASASYSSVSGTFTFQSATATPAYVDCASVLIRNFSASSKALTLQAPAAMAADYSLTLPPLPASQKIMTLDSSGNITAPYTVDGSTITIATNVIGVPASGIGTTQLAAQAVTAAKIANATITTSQISASAGILGTQIANTTISNSNIANSTIDLTTKVTGTLPVANGGTGVTTSTGTGNTVRSASPTFTGTISAAALTLSSTLGVTGAATLSSTLGVTGAATLSSTLGVTGAATFSGGVIGSLGFSAPTGYVGETLTVSNAGGTAPTASNTATNITSLSLTAGSWLLFGDVSYNFSAVTATRLTAGISTSSAAFDSITSGAYSDQSPLYVPTSGSFGVLPLGSRVINIETTTTVYGVARITFSAGSPTFGFHLIAYRLR